MVRAIWLATVVAGFFALAGCATPLQKQYAVNPTDAGRLSFEVIDARPAAHLVSHGVGSSDGDTFVLGDESFSGSRLKLLAGYLQSRWGQELAGRQVKVTGFEVNVHLARAPTNYAGAYVPSTGSLAADIAGALIAGVIIAKLKEADSFTVGARVGGEVDGQRFNSFSTVSVPRDQVERGVQEALTKVLDGLGDDFSKMSWGAMVTAVSTPIADATQDTR